MIEDKLKILIVEDETSHFKIIEHQIKKIVKDPDITHVETFDKFEKELKSIDPDMIICDYNLNTFTGLEVLLHVKEQNSKTYFVFVTGTISNKEIADNTILNGASGYILKNDINKLQNKLLPHFEEIVLRKRNAASNQYREMIDYMNNFVKSANKSNEEHIKNYLQMKKVLEEFKKKINY